MKTLFGALLLAALATSAARAASISIVLDKPNQTLTPGGTIQFFGTITDLTGSPVFLDSDSLTDFGANFTVTDNLLSNVPYELDPTPNSGDIDLFDISANSPFVGAPGPYLGSYILQDPNGATLGTVTFSFTLPAPPAPAVPEPATLALVLTGLPAAFAARRRR